MGNLILCGKICDTANYNENKKHEKKEKELVSNLLLKIDFLENKLLALKDDIKEDIKNIKQDLQYDIKEVKNDLMILIKFLNK